MDYIYSIASVIITHKVVWTFGAEGICSVVGRALIRTQGCVVCLAAGGAQAAWTCDVVRHQAH